MKRIYQITVLSLIGILAEITTINAQLYEVSLDKKIQQSSLIVEGRVVAQECFCSSDGRIYTANRIAVSALLKGILPSGFITVNTWGGKYGGVTESWTHMLTLQPGEEGIFFLEESKAQPISNPSFPSPAFEVFSSSQGFLKFARTGKGTWVAYEPFHTYENIKDEIYDCVSGMTGQSYTIIDASRSMLSRSGIRYLFKTTSFSGSTINFDIIVSSLYGSKQLHKAGAALNYNPDFFGANIATSGNLALQENGISANPVYTLTKSNLSSNKVKIELSTTGSVTNISSLTSTEQILAKGSLTIENLFASPGISFDVSEMYSLSKFWEGGVAYEFDTIVVETDIDLHGACNDNDPPVITSFSPDDCIRAGTGDILTIRGTCFGDSIWIGIHNVEFTNAKAGTSPVEWIFPHKGEYLRWNDTLIVVKVPSRVFQPTLANTVGSGFFRVKKFSLYDTSAVELCVLFSVLNDDYFPPTWPDVGIMTSPIYLGNYNGHGGQSIYYDDGFKAYPGATDAFERALINWRCATGINYVIEEYNVSVDLSTAGIVGFAELPAGIAGATSNTSPDDVTPCDSLGYQVGANRTNFSIIFNKNVYWHTDTLMPPLNQSILDPVDTLDLESTALHELGHAHLLQHTNDSTDLMFYRKPFGVEYRRVITANSLAGGNYVMNISTNTASDSCHTKMEKVTGDCSVVNEVIELSQSLKAVITLFPNPTNSILNVLLDFHGNSTGEKLRWTLHDLTGHAILSGTLLEANSINMQHLPSGIYFFKVGIGGDFVKSFSVIKQ